MTTQDFPPQRRLGPILLAPGVTPAQILIFLGVLLCATVVNSFFQIMQPLILGDVLHIPASQQGRLAGVLATTQQVGVLVFIGISGALADRLGRRNVLMMALAGFAVLMLAYPFIAAVWGLFLVRFLWGASFTGWTAGGATKMMDYPDNNSRGKFIGLMLIVQGGMGALFLALVSSRLPSFLRGLGLPMAEATRYAFWAIAMVAVAGAAAAFFFLTKDATAKPTTAVSAADKVKLTLAQFREVFQYARSHPKFGIVLLIGVVIRTEGVIHQAFLPQWVISAGRAAGIESATALKTAGLLSSILLIALLVGPFVFGPIADKVNRIKMLILALLVTGLAWSCFAFVGDVFSIWMIVVVCLVGIAEGFQTIAVQSVFAQEAPPHLRGSSMGMMVGLGTLSALLVTWLGGYLFDKVGYQAPFVMEGVLSLSFFVIAALVLRAQLRNSGKTDAMASH